MPHEIAFEMAVSSIRFGPGVTREVGMDLADLGARNVLVLTDPVLRSLSPVLTVLESLETNRIAATLYDRVRVEPTDESFLDAITFARQGSYDAIVAVGGGSTIDTAKAVNLYVTYPPDNFLDYVNPPIGKGLPVPGPLKPLIAIPTTAGTGSETTGVTIFDLIKMHAKTGIASRRLKPTLGLLDPENTRTMPSQVAASSGLDILSHAVESFTALPFSKRPLPDRPLLRPAYQGSNPISDVWSLEAMRMVAQYLVRAVEDPSDDEARANMLLAASYAGVGFGNAGVHLPHGMSYPVSGNVKSYLAPGYTTDHALVPHGFSVILNAPAVFRYTASANPERHVEAAAALGVDVARCRAADAGRILSERITWFMERLKTPNGLREIGYTSSDIPALVEGTLPQHRVTKLSPRPAGPADLARLFEESLSAW
jgi:hydroxyacid-oxoacid transhydrogenase